MARFCAWLREKHIWSQFSPKDRVEIRWIIDDVEHGSVGIGLVGLFQLNYSYVAQVC